MNLIMFIAFAKDADVLLIGKLCRCMNGWIGLGPDINLKKEMGDYLIDIRYTFLTIIIIVG